MNGQKWILIIPLLLFIFITASSIFKWTHQVKEEKVSVTRFLKTMLIILTLSLAFVTFISLPLIGQPKIKSIAISAGGIILLLFGIIINVAVARQLMKITFHMEGSGTPDRLITNGLFSIIRHPSSLGIIFIFIGWYLAWGAWMCLIFIIPVLVVGIFIENRLEEKNLKKQFGDEYLTYKKKVGMYFPKIKTKMTFENESEIVLLFIEAINSADIDSIVNLMSEDHIFIDSGDGKYQGKENMKQGWIEYFKMFPDYRIEITDIIDKGSHIGVFGYANGSYQGSGNCRFRIPASWKAIVKDQRIKHWQIYCDTGTIEKAISGNNQV